MTMLKKNLILIIIVFIFGLLLGIYVGRKKGIPFVEKRDIWSIGIYTGKDPINIEAPKNIKNPVLTAKDVTDIPAEFVADPFMIKEGSKWYMFFEVMNTHTNEGDIGLATSDDGYKWEYQKIVLDEPFHVSYPYVFKWENEFYMIPESNAVKDIRLYKAEEFPTKWVFVKNIIEGHFSDPSIFRYDNKWWIFAGSNPYSDDTLRLYYSDDLQGEWEEHPKSPIVSGNVNIARPGGRVINDKGHIYRFAQDCYPHYGNKVRVFEIIKLSTTEYEEKEAKEKEVIGANGDGWNSFGMHTVDAHKLKDGEWIATVDGYKKKVSFGLHY